jgi:hypothetical protein
VINNNTYSTGWDANACVALPKFNNLVQVNRDNTAINIYILDNSTWNQGLAEGIPGRALVIGGKVNNVELVTSLVIAHELGHCLNLFHTHHGCTYEALDCSGTTVTPVCFELPNGTNGTTCGDFVADTPADPRINFLQTNCVWDKTVYTPCIAPNLTVNSYSPDMTNIMSYTPPNRMVGFTEGQANRMRTELQRTGSILSGVKTTFNNIPNLASVNITLNSSVVTG